MTQKTGIASPEVEERHKSKKMPLVSCNKYDEEERKALFGEKAIPEPFSGFLDE